MEINNPMEISPEKFYLDTLRGVFEQIQMECHYDPNLTKSVENVENKLDVLTTKIPTKPVFEQIISELRILQSVTTSTSYLQGTLFNSKASSKEKELVHDMNKKIADMLMIVQYTKVPESEPSVETRKRIGYDENKKENSLEKSSDTSAQRHRVPNYNR